MLHLILFQKCKARFFKFKSQSENFDLYNSTLLWYGWFIPVCHNAHDPKSPKSDLLWCILIFKLRLLSNYKFVFFHLTPSLVPTENFKPVEDFHENQLSWSSCYVPDCPKIPKTSWTSCIVFANSNFSRTNILVFSIFTSRDGTSLIAEKCSETTLIVILASVPWLSEISRQCCFCSSPYSMSNFSVIRGLISVFV